MPPCGQETKQALAANKAVKLYTKALGGSIPND